MTRSAPLALLVEPLTLTAALTLVVNDHLMKVHWPGFLSGKLSDVAFMVLMPLWLYALVRLAAPRATASTTRRHALLGALVVGTALLFTAMQVTDVGDIFYRYLLGGLQWPFRSVSALVNATSSPQLRPVVATPDATDLWCLPFLAVPVARGRRGLP